MKQAMTPEERRERAYHQKAEEAQGKLTRAFGLLRKEGFVTRQRFSCCRGCAGSALVTEQKAKQAAGKKVPKGYVFYTKQDGFLEHVGQAALRPRKVYLSYGEFNSKGSGVTSDLTGHKVVKALREAGLAFEWNGNPDTCIVVDPCPGLWDS